VTLSSLAGKSFRRGRGTQRLKMMLDRCYDNVRVSYIMPASADTGLTGDPAKRESGRHGEPYRDAPFAFEKVSFETVAEMPAGFSRGIRSWNVSCCVKLVRRDATAPVGLGT